MPLSEIDLKQIHKLGEVLESSHDPDRPVGVLIADPDGKILATGTNQPPTKFGYDVTKTHTAIRDDPTWKYYMLEHAERNAILQALIDGKDLNGATMYGTLFPCADCARAIVAAGIRKMVVPAPGIHPSRDVKWREHYEYAHRIFDLAGTLIEPYTPAELTAASRRT